MSGGPSLRRRVWRRGPWEMAATICIATGVVMLVQPFLLVLYSWSLAVTLTGVVTFTIVSKFPD
jgi:hypothetical protein